MRNLVIVGAQWGDEGKGKIVDYFCGDFDYVVRFGGGANAGHTLVVDGRKVSVHLLPSGWVRGKICMLGPGMVIDPNGLRQEMEQVAVAGRSLATGQLRISARAQLVMPYHRQLDELREGNAGALGTTRRGIGPAYEDKAARRGLRMVDLLAPERATGALEVAHAAAAERIAALGGRAPELSAMQTELREQAKHLAPYVCDASLELHQAIRAGKRVLFEGAQGVLLDLDHGTYPFVTSSTTLPGGACAGAGLGPSLLDDVVGVTKAYTTRVGAGPFPTELGSQAAAQLRQRGGEFGATTGRPRRCGWLDLPALRYAVRVGGLSKLALTKLDVLAGMAEPYVCTAYELNGKSQEEVPVHAADWQAVKPIYRRVEGFDSLDDEVQSYADLPRSARDFVELVEREVDCQICLVSVGPGRGQTLPR